MDDRHAIEAALAARRRDASGRFLETSGADFCRGLGVKPDSPTEGDEMHEDRTTDSPDRIIAELDREERDAAETWRRDFIRALGVVLDDEDSAAGPAADDKER